MGKLLNVVILGYYDALNAGDECFKHIFKSILNQDLYHLEFINPVVRLKQDAAWKLPSDTNCVIVGGGDIINDHFMPSIRKLLIGFTGPRLAIGVGISYPDCAPYLKSFDRIIVRSHSDYEMAQSYVQKDYLEYFPDISVFLDRKQQLPYKALRSYPQDHFDFEDVTLRISVCIAEPCLATAYEHGERLTVDLANALVRLTTHLLSQSKLCNKITLTFVPFNTNIAQPEECDLVAIDRVKTLMSEHPQFPQKLTLQVLDTSVARNTDSLFRYFIQECDFAVCMRYHSVMFALMSGTPFIALYSTPKIGNLLSTIGVSEEAPQNHRMQYIDNQSHIPQTFDEDRFVSNVMVAMEQPPSYLSRDGMPFYSHSNNEFAAHIRKLIRSKPLFPVIKAETGFQLRFLDEHHLNRLTMGVIYQYLHQNNNIKLTEDSQIMDDILDDQSVLTQVLLPNESRNDSEFHYKVAADLCKILLTRMHMNFTEPTNFMSLSSGEEMEIKEVGRETYDEYLHGFAEKLFQPNGASLRIQLSWIAIHHFRHLHPLQDPLQTSNQSNF